MKKVLFLVAALLLLSSCSEEVSNEENVVDEVETVEVSGSVTIEDFYIYGESLTMDLDQTLVLGDTSIDTSIFDELIDRRLKLYDFPVGEYYMLNKTDDEYSYILKSDFEEVDFYTVLRNGTRKHLVFNQDDNGILVKVEEVDTLPADVYDFVVNPGHGGSDSGTQSPFIGETEREWVLDISLDMKEKFEALGYKVFITRSTDEAPGGNELDRIPTDPYVDGGRVDLIYQSQGKYVFANHLNSFRVENGREGTEIYSSVHTSTDFSKTVLEAIVAAGGVKSNHGTSYRVEEGIYKRAYTLDDYESTKASLEGYGETVYNVFNEVSYDEIDRYWEVRETGGIALHAFSDGRHPKYEANNYMNSIVGLETLVIEYGYLNSESDAYRFLENKEAYIDSVVKAFDQFINE